MDDRCTPGCPPFMSCIGCAWFAVKRSFTTGHAAAEHIPVGRRPSIEEPKASRYKEYKQLSLEL